MKPLLASLLSALLAACHAHAEEVDFDKPAIGILMSDLQDNAKLAGDAGLDLPTQRGVIVKGVWDGGPADKAGLQALDVITHVGGQRVSTEAEASEALASAAVGKEVKLRIYRPQGTKVKVRWRRRAVDVTPCAYGEFLASQFDSEFDEIARVTRYQMKNVEYDPKKGGTGVVFWVEQPAGKPGYAVMRVRYNAEDWLFVRHALFTFGGHRVQLEGLSFTRDNTSRIWEWCDLRCDGSDHSEAVRGLIARLATGEDCTMVLFGEKYRHDEDLPSLVGGQARVIENFLSLRGWGE